MSKKSYCRVAEDEVDDKKGAKHLNNMVGSRDESAHQRMQAADNLEMEQSDDADGTEDPQDGNDRLA